VRKCGRVKVKPKENIQLEISGWWKRDEMGSDLGWWEGDKGRKSYEIQHLQLCCFWICSIVLHHAIPKGYLITRHFFAYLFHNLHSNEVTSSEVLWWIFFYPNVSQHFFRVCGLAKGRPYSVRHRTFGIFLCRLVSSETNICKFLRVSYWMSYGWGEVEGEGWGFSPSMRADEMRLDSERIGLVFL